MHYNLLLSDINCQVFIYSVNLEVLRLHKRWIGLSGRGQEGVFGANIVYFTRIVLQTYCSVGGVGLLVRCKRVFGVDAFDIRKYRSNILSNQL